MWPAFVVPFVGWWGWFSPLLVWLAAVFPLQVLWKAAHRQARAWDFLCLPLYVVMLVRVQAFSADWFALYGD